MFGESVQGVCMSYYLLYWRLNLVLGLSAHLEVSALIGFLQGNDPTRVQIFNISSGCNIPQLD